LTLTVQRVLVNVMDSINSVIFYFEVHTIEFKPSFKKKHIDKLVTNVT